jgi:hypothetical protein
VAFHGAPMALRQKTPIITPVLPDGHRMFREGPRARDETLTHRVREMLQRAAQSCSNTEIADRPPSRAANDRYSLSVALGAESPFAGCQICTDMITGAVFAGVARSQGDIAQRTHSCAARRGRSSLARRRVGEDTPPT